MLPSTFMLSLFLPAERMQAVGLELPQSALEQLLEEAKIMDNMRHP